MLYFKLEDGAVTSGEKMTNGHIDPDFEAKLHLYKTAFSPLYDTYVGIEGLRKLPDGSHILDCVVPFNEALIMFRPHELTNFVM